MTASLRPALLGATHPTMAGLADLAAAAAGWAFATAVVLSPFRARIVLAARPSPPVYADFTDVLLFWSEAAVLVTVGLWLVSLVLRPGLGAARWERRRFAPGLAFLIWPAAGLIALAWLGVPGSLDPAGAASQAVGLMLLAAFAAYVFVEVRDPRRLLVPVGAMVVLQAAIGLGQLMTQGSLGLGGLGELTLSPSLPVSVVTTADGLRVLRAYGLTDHPNILGGLLAVGSSLLAAAFAVEPPARRRLRRGLVLAFAIGLAGLLATFSRGGFLALGAGLLVLVTMLLRSRDRTAPGRLGVILLAGLLVAAPLAVAFLPALAARSGTQGPIATEAASIDERLAVDALAVSIAAAHPVLGVGLGQLPRAEQVARPGFAFEYQPASLVPLDAAAETGLVGGLLVLVVTVAPWVALVRLRSAWTPALVVASAALAAVALVGFVDYYIWTDAPGRIWAWLVLGLWAVAYRDARAAGARRAA